jgi:hypothetical protein
MVDALIERTESTRRKVILAIAGGVLGGCGAKSEAAQPSIEFSRVPQSDPGGRDKHDIIDGRVRGAVPGDRIVLYARNGNWWVQPLGHWPFTVIKPDSNWTSATHLGTEYAALLVKPGFQPAAMLTALPGRGGLISAVTIVKGASTAPSPSIQFSGYEWRVRTAPSDRGGKSGKYDARNAWTDEDGAMHLRIAKFSDEWTCAEVSLTRSLGYGKYFFTARDTSGLQPAEVFGMFTWDYARPDQNFSEASIEISRWGDPAGKKAQYVIQPHYIPANVSRFAAPSGKLTHSFQWEPGRMWFRTWRGSEHGGKAGVIAEHVFNSGIPSPAIESVRMNLYVWGYSHVLFADGAEVVIERFEYLP